MHWPLGSGQGQITEKRVRHGGGLHLQINAFDLSLGVDHEGVPHHAHVFTAHEFLQTITFVETSDFAGFDICQQGEGEGMFVDEFGVRRGVVFANAKYFDFIFFE